MQTALAASGFTVSDRGKLRAAGDTARNASSAVNLVALIVILGYIAIGRGPAIGDTHGAHHRHRVARAVIKTGEAHRGTR